MRAWFLPALLGSLLAAAGTAGSPPTPPRWQHRMKILETDFIGFAAKDRVLVGTLDTYETFYGLKPHEIRLLDPADGALVWARSREAFGLPQSLLAVDPVVLIEGAAQYAGLDPGSGAVLWTRPRAGEEALILPGQGLMILAAAKKPQAALAAVDVKTGREVWAVPAGEEAGARGRPLAAGAILLVPGPELAAYAAADGKPLWKAPFPGTYGKSAAVIPLGEDLYCTDGASLTRTDPASGSELWHGTWAGGGLRGLSGDGRRVFILRSGPGAGQPDEIEARDARTGKPLWKAPLPDQAASPATLAGDRLYVATPGSLVALDAARGTPVFTTPIPPELQSRRTLPDLLRCASGRIVLAREIGVMAVQKEDGRLIYAEPAVGSMGSTYAYWVNKLNHAQLSEAPLDLKIKAFAEQEKTRMNLIVHGVGQPQPGLRGGLPALVGGVLTAATTTAVAVLETQWHGRRMGVLQAQLAQTLATHADSLQEDVYVRPCYLQDRGWFLHVVDLASGRPTDLLLSPDRELPAPFFADLPAFAQRGGLLVSKGLGPDPEHAVGHRGLLRISYDITYPSILAFDLAAPPPAPGAGRPGSPPLPADPGRRPLNDQLIQAAYRSDLPAIKQSLEAGADVNALDDYGQSALMLAAESTKSHGKTDIVEFLLQRGADARLRDPSGLTAVEHMYLMAIGIEGPQCVFTVKKMLEKAQKNPRP